MDTQTATVTEDNVSLGDKRVETSTFDRYKGRKDVTDRLALISTNLIRGYTYFYQNGSIKKLFRSPTDPETLKMVKGALGEPEQRFGVLVFHYLTDEKGELIEADKLRGKVKLWVWSEARYEEISNINRNWPLLDGGFSAAQHDLNATCTEENFQRMQWTPCPTAHWKQKEAWYKALKEKEAKALPKLRMALGRVLTTPEIMALLGTGTAPPTQAAGIVDLSDVIDEI